MKILQGDLAEHAAQLVEGLSSMQATLGVARYKLGAVGLVCTQEVEAGASAVQGHSPLPRDFEASLDCMGLTLLKK